ncbi:MAG: EpsI family protein [Deltaproteobacteria bacterium RBG_19FT_COMBO_56_10]|nr:MAG: EpsI family protein [Deltaproteobacteria bacterium RBG_19FT_COMBO_56_10]
MNRRLLIVSALTAVLAAYLMIFPFQDSVPLRKAFTEFPFGYKGWSGNPGLLDDRSAEILKLSEYMLRGYSRDKDNVSIYIGYYGSQRGGSQIHSPKLCLPASGWAKVSEGTRSMDIDGLGKINLVQAVYQKEDRKEVFVYWYQMKGAYITDEYALRLHRFLNSVKYRRNDAAFVRLSAPVNGTVEDAVSTIEGFMKDFLPVLKDYLPE